LALWEPDTSAQRSGEASTTLFCLLLCTQHCFYGEYGGSRPISRHCKILFVQLLHLQNLPQIPQYGLDLTEQKFAIRFRRFRRRPAHAWAKWAKIRPL
jgi:hypothetical protein